MRWHIYCRASTHCILGPPETGGSLVENRSEAVNQWQEENYFVLGVEIDAAGVPAVRKLVLLKDFEARFTSFHRSQYLPRSFPDIQG